MLNGVWAEQESIESVSNMGFDTVVIAAGAACADIKELKETVPLKRVRGQVCFCCCLGQVPEPQYWQLILM